MASPEPTIEECAAFGTPQDVADWVGLRHRRDGEAEDAKSPRGTLFKELGVEEDTSIMTLAAMPVPDWDAAVTDWKIDGAAPSRVLRTQAGLLGLACRIYGGQVKRRELIEQDAKRKREEEDAERASELEAKRIELDILKAKGLVDAGKPKTTDLHLALMGVKRVKLSTVIDQANDTETEMLPKEDILACYKRFTTLTGDIPARHEELTDDQVSGLKAVFDSGGAPYADFSLFGPNGHRLAKRIRFTGLVFTAGGELKPKELFGPGNFEEWTECWHLYRTGCMMLGTICTSVLDSYARHIARYAKLNPTAWAIIYQADVRARAEQIERHCRQGALELAEANAAGVKCEFDIQKPWEYSFRKLIKDSDFWKEELEEPCWQVKSRLERMDNFIDGDAKTSGASYVTSGVAGAPAKGSGKNSRRSETSKSSWAGDLSSKGDNGDFITTRKGKHICRAYNSGSCTTVNNRCPADPSRAHQCSICLAQHPRSECKSIPGGGGSKGKGKGKGKKGSKDAPL